MVSKEAQAAIDMLFANKKASAAAGKPSAEQVVITRNMLSERLGAAPVPDCIEIEEISEGDVKGEWHHYIGPDKDTEHVLLFAFGGGFETGSVVSRRQVCCNVVKYGKFDAFAVSYRQWPEHHHPAALLDCLTAFHYLVQKGYDPRKIRMFGESAGAMLTLTTMLWLKDHGFPYPERVSVFSPVLDPLSLETPSHTANIDRDPMLNGVSSDSLRFFTREDFDSPYGAARLGDFHGFPKLLVNVGSEEILFDDSMLLKRLCEEAGADVTVKVWDGMFHSFCLFPCPETEQVSKEIGEFLAE